MLDTYLIPDLECEMRKQEKKVTYFMRSFK
jgi:hypothetical protein